MTTIITVEGRDLTQVSLFVFSNPWHCHLPGLSLTKPSTLSPMKTIDPMPGKETKF